jgi:hypothetical protein
MLGWSLGISSCASNFGWVPPTLPSGPTVAKPRGDNGTAHVDLTLPTPWPGCSYLLELGTVRALTDGDQDDLGRDTPLTFCIDN